MEPGANNGLSPSYNILYNQPYEEITGVVSLTRLIPQSGPTVSAGQNIVFLATNNNSFVDQHRTYINMDLNLIGTTAANYVQPVGGSCIIQAVNETFGEAFFPQLTDYPLLQACKNASTSLSRKTIISLTEGWNVVSGITNTSGTAITQAGGPVRFQLPLPCQTVSSTSIIPLAFLIGGYRVEIITNSFANIFGLASGNSTGTSYSLTNVEMILALVKPPDSLLADYTQRISRGEYLYFPMNQTKNFPIPTTPGSHVFINQQIGYYKSVNNLLFTYRKVANLTGGLVYNPSTDILQKWQVNLNLIPYPSNTYVYASGNSPVSQETLLQTIRPYNVLSESKSAYVASLSGYMNMNFESNNTFNAGIPSNNGLVTLDAYFNTNTLSGDIFNIFVEYSSPVRVGATAQFSY